MVPVCSDNIYYHDLFSGIRAYEQLGNRAFGRPGKMLAGVIITVHNIGGIVVILH